MKAGNEWGCSPGGKTAVDKQSLDVFEGFYHVLPWFTYQLVKHQALVKSHQLIKL